MENNTAELWFSWFYKKWEKNAPGNLIEQGLTPSQIAEAQKLARECVRKKYKGC